MPARNAIKQYIENGYYHIYNRGVEKRRIFLDEQDYNVFLKYLKEYLNPKDEDSLRRQLTHPMTCTAEKDKILKLLRLNNFHEEITMLAYCLMTNHFHFFVKQKNKKSIDSFMQSISTSYTLYFNRKYKRVGSLFQSVYKAILITNEQQFLHLSRYIHKQALASLAPEAEQNQPCSFQEYIGNRHTEWIHPENILTYFSKNIPSLSYEAFIRQSEDVQYVRGFMI